MTVPETPVNEDGCSMFGQYDIWRTREVTAMEPEAITECVKNAPNDYLRLGVLLADGPHYAATGRVDINLVATQAHGSSLQSSGTSLISLLMASRSNHAPFRAIAACTTL